MAQNDPNDNLLRDGTGDVVFVNTYDVTDAEVLEGYGATDATIVDYPQVESDLNESN